MNAVHPEPAAGGNDYNRQVIDEFRTSAGTVGGDFAGKNLLLLTTRGRQSGEPRTTPLVYLRDGGRVVVFALNGGAPADPLWYRNLAAAPEVTVELGADRFAAHAVPVDPDDHEDLWARQISVEPLFADFRARTSRTVPLVELRPAA
ncbi:MULTISPECIES: nitroreductase family deazaflavin-dependent oxidoreductase [unclassified Streptomyces]|uniref:nitroreductase family deazaflavin-dependent oxidoreductase n=1 Tax=Streptomycetaceae TaxID=2062 RepID=UPI002E7844C9|nr:MULTISPECIES: nitroreductase family deazaflavin-dependent oxidoreductase [unclassified Streptomyces]MED7953404.1 nitroreductase family deazaflavin-dependent oxidoreductase [Streptomyces sp. BE303]MEE1823130.1 nitroreductase family deazaflavin-dependent oxidoreductase [Streptomyces sp. BE20]